MVRRNAVVASVAWLAAIGGGCQAQPDRLCDRARVVWPFFDVDAGDDVDPDVDGIQIDLVLRSSLNPDSVAVLSVIGPDMVAAPHPETAVVAADGGLAFRAVTVPTGRVQLSLVIHDECGPLSSARRLYVWDGAGYPACELALGVQPAPSPEHEPLGVIAGDADVDPATDGVQLPVLVEAGRPDMAIALFVREVATGRDVVHEEDSGEDRAATFVVTAPPGEVAIRAVCTWTAEDLRPSSHTERFVVVP
jgi:hypothetical protein